MRLDGSVEARLWARIDRRGPDECWPYGNGRSYGYISVGGRKMLAHRLVYLLVYGELKRGEVVRHTCDNPPCCNPTHLLSGTQLDNMADARDRGRRRFTGSPGEQNGNAKLTAERVMAMRCMYASGATQREVAALFGVTRSLAHRIVTGRAWAHVPMPVRRLRHGPGLCGCGCGQRAPLAAMTNRRLGHVKGQPTRFARGHSGGAFA